MRTSHTLLLRLWHDPSFTFSLVEVTYCNRGAPGDETTVAGTDISGLLAEYFTILRSGQEVCIPYHRLRRICYQGRTLWSREEGLI
ncbi:MAG: DUF504 domain-containing protein [Methanospirillaceae archaeon]|nr:DUF504 domain-containing protein [Methanospirillaceae archaeon]